MITTNMDAAERLAGAKRAIDGRLPRGIRVEGIALAAHTRRGLPYVDRVAEWDGWDGYHDLAVATLFAIQVGVVALFGATAWLAVTSRIERTPAHDPANALAIPGVNEFMPLAAALYVVGGLMIATVIHELGHAIACRREGIRIEEWGVVLLFGIVPVAGYVLPDEDQLDGAPDRTRMRVFSAGVFDNAILAAVTGVALLLPFTAAPQTAYMTYFGWAITGGAPPTAGAIASLGVVSNLLFWTAFLSANVALMNALPVGILDGGRVFDLVSRKATDRLSVSPRTTTAAVRAVSVCTTLLVGVAVFGPHVT